MSKLSYIEKLLNGAEVSWLPVAELFYLKNGYTPSKSKKEFWEGGNIPWFRMDDIRQNGQILGDSLQKITGEAVKGGKLFAENSMIFATSATIGEHALITVPYLANQRFTNLTVKEEYAEIVDIKYLYYYGFLLSDWCKKNTTMSSFASVDMDGFRKFEIPIPCPENQKKSLEIQAEIVRILDAFTSLTAELTAELTARNKQYNYYRNQLLTFSETQVEWKPLGDVTKIKRGTSITKKNVVEGDIPVIAGGRKPAYYHNESNRTGQSIVIAGSGAYAGFVSWWEEPIFVSDAFTVKPNDGILSRYCFHFLQSLQQKLHDFKSGSGVPHVYPRNVAPLKIPIPPPEEQARIVNILDKFDALTNSISEGLPREIELRSKQYEYYRDLLLNFPKPQDPINSKAAA